ncbi:MAG TPA: MmcQ/YjbR family DNA-binding protein [Flavihumibacter sp.]|jgi:predicted DNA-binding protein (MmcQ/YjbR family)
MVSLAGFREMASSFEQAETSPHFEKESFRVKKKIFATLDLTRHRGTVRLSGVDQSVFCAIDPAIIYPVEGGWGRQGWTHVELKKVKKDLLLDLLTTAYCTVAPPKLAAKYRPEQS